MNFFSIIYKTLNNRHTFTNYLLIYDLIILMTFPLAISKLFNKTILSEIIVKLNY